MANEKFTPGPWKVGNGRKTDLYMGWNTVLGLLDGEKFVLCQTNHHYEEASTANALLIAAAPDLYRELENARDIYCADNCGSVHSETCKEWTALLAKARGES